MADELVLVGQIELEQKVDTHDDAIRQLIEAIRQAHGPD